jgi:peptidyl-prolyl cis-trans isomerase D
MLKALGRLERTRNIVIVGFAFLMALSLILFYGPGRSRTTIDPAKNTEAVAKVGSDTITVAELARMRDNIMQMYGGRMNLAALGGSRRFLDTLISKRVIVQEAQRLGFGASDAELREKLLKQFSDASGQFVGYDRYKESITARYGDIESFENEMRDSIAQEKLRAFVTASVNVSDDEVREEFKRRNTSFDVSYVALSADKLAEKIQPTDEELRNYYESHKTDYRYLEPQKKVKYLFIDTEKAGSKLQISDADLQTEFKLLKPPYNEAGIKIQQIVLKVARKDLDAQVEQKGKDLIAKLMKSGGTVSEQDFAEAAKGNSEDPATARNGGFLAAPFKQNPNKPNGLYDRMVTMKPGEVFDIPIRYAGDFYILRRGDSVPKTFEQAKPELLVSLRNRRGYDAAFQIAKKAKDELQKTKDIQKVAQEFAPQANMTAAEMVRETPYIKPGDDVPSIGANQQFEQSVESLNNVNDVGEPTGVKSGFAIPMLVDKKDPRIPDFDEVKSKIADSMKQQRAKDQLEQKAKDLLASLNSPDAIKAAGEKDGYDADVVEDFKLNSALGKAGTSAALDDAIYGMKEGEIAKAPIKVDDKWVIVGIVKRRDPDFSSFNNGERERLRDQLLSTRQNQVFEDYIARVQQKMKQDGKIKIYEDVLNQIDEAEAASEPAPPQGLNLPGGQ